MDRTYKKKPPVDAGGGFKSGGFQNAEQKATVPLFSVPMWSIFFLEATQIKKKVSRTKKSFSPL
jgi:hypothetical protein